MRKKRLKKIILVLLVIVIILGLIITKLSTKRDSKESFKYIISDEMDRGTVSPSMIHVVVALYKGSVNPKTISKSAYYFVNTVIPKYKKKCSSIDKAKSYFEKNKNDIYLDTGIDNEEDFIKLTNQINKIKKSKIESSRFDKDYIITTNQYLETILYVKNKDDTEIDFKVVIYNEAYSTKPSIKYSVN